MTTTERPAQPGEMCDCGHPARTVYVTENFGDVPYCGVPRSGEEPDAGAGLGSSSTEAAEEDGAAERDRGFKVHIVETIQTLIGQTLRVALCGHSWTEERTYWCLEPDGTTWGHRKGTPILCTACEASLVLLRANR